MAGMHAVDLATHIAYLFLTLGVVFQIVTTYRSGSAGDIDIREVVGRFIAQLIIMWKVIIVADFALLFGHAVLTLVYTAYLTLVFRYKFFKAAS